MSGERLLILHDSSEFGGHERAFLRWLSSLLADERLIAATLISPSSRFLEALQLLTLERLRIRRNPYSKQRAEPYRAPLRFLYGRYTRALFKETMASRVLLLQGRIESLATPLRWLPRSAYVVSYMPMAHSGVEMGKHVAASALGDAAKRSLYRRPDRFIVPSKAVALQLKRAGATAPVSIVPNVPSAISAPVPQVEARKTLGLEAKAQVALVMGRLDGQQKGLDRLCRDLSASAKALGDWTFRFVGEGRGSAALIEVFSSTSLRIQVRGWTSSPHLELSAADVLLMPSRFEGVPLVILESMQIGTPVLASDISEFRELLPAENLRNFSRPVDLASALAQVTTPQARSQFRTHASRLLSSLSADASSRQFAEAVLTPLTKAAK